MNSKIFNTLCKKNSKNKKTALIFENQIISYSELITNSKIVAENLSRENKLLKTRIIVALENSEKYVYLLLAASKLNLSLVLVSPDIRSNELNEIKKDASLLIVDKKNIKIYKLFLNKINLYSIEDLIEKKNNKLKRLVNLKKKDFIINFSSGSTGDPKEIIYTQELKIERAKQLKLNILSKKNNTFINYAPIYHSLGQRLVFSSILNTNKLILMRKFNFFEWEKSIKKYKVTILFPISSHLNILVESLLRKKNNYISVEKIVASSSQITKKTKNTIVNKFKNIFYEAYGAAEVAFVSILRPIDHKSKKNSVGKILKDIKIHVLRNNKKSSYGEICCKTKFLSKFSQKEKNNSKIFYKKTFFRTGDLGYLDKDKYLYYVSRNKDIIIKSGLNIIPKIIEDRILEETLIKKCAVIGVKDEIFGETPIAICEIIKSQRYLAEKFESNLLYKLSKQQMPAKFIYVNSLKFLPTGKIDKVYYKKKYSKMIINKGKTKLFIS